MIRSCRQKGIFGLILILGAVPSVQAGELTEQIKQTTDKILSIVQDPALRDPNKEPERRRRIRQIVDERFDWEAMARSAMGNHWKGLTSEQRKEFVQVFSQLVEQNYMAKVEGYSGEKIVYKGEKVSGKYGVGDVAIFSTSGTEIPVRYRVVKMDERWMVYDIGIEGVSMVNNYRGQIGSVLDKSSYDDLVKKIRATLTQGQTAQTDPNGLPKAAQPAPRR